MSTAIRRIKERAEGFGEFGEDGELGELGEHGEVGEMGRWGDEERGESYRLFITHYFLLLTPYSLFILPI